MARSLSSSALGDGGALVGDSSPISWKIFSQESSREEWAQMPMGGSNKQSRGQDVPIWWRRPQCRSSPSWTIKLHKLSVFEQYYNISHFCPVVLLNDQVEETFCFWGNFTFVHFWILMMRIERAWWQLLWQQDRLIALHNLSTTLFFSSSFFDLMPQLSFRHMLGT